MGVVEQIGPYRVLGTLGEGGMGVVYRALCPHTGAQVALKTARAADADLSRLRNEILALSRVSHPRVARLLESGTHEGLPWYAMELIQGSTLEDFNGLLWHALERPAPASDTWDGVAAPHPIPWQGPCTDRVPAARGRLTHVLQLYRRLCVPIGVLHANGIVHRDLKPANVILRDDATPVLVDLGLVSRFGGAVGRERLEPAGRAIGTVMYMSPEQAQGLAVDGRADLYAFGAMLYETVTGRVPFEGGSPTELMTRVVTEPPIPPSALAAGVPDELEALILALLAKSRRHRIGHVEEVAAALERLGAVGDEARVPATPRVYRPEIVGRDRELARLAQTLDAALEGACAIALIGGPSGVGKTFLASHSATAAARRGIQVLVGECVANVSCARPLDALRPLLEAIADAARGGGPEVARALIGDRAEVLGACEPSLLDIPGVSKAEAAEPAGEDRLHAALNATVAAWIAARGPAVLLLDDLHWADDPSLAWLATLARAPIKGLLVIGTFRSDHAAPGLEALLGEPRAELIPLAHLDHGSRASG